MSEHTAITNVRVFDGNSITEPKTVLIENGVISDGDAQSATTRFDGNGGTLLPGLIDAHVHLTGIPDLEHATQWGVTTMLDMGSPAMALTDALRHQPRLSTVLGAGNSASAPGGLQTTRMGFPQSSAVTGPEDAARFVAARVAEHADYIKVIVEDPRMGTPALSGETVAALVTAAHNAHLKIIAHISTTTALRIAGDAGVDVVTHAPLNADVDSDIPTSFAARGVVSVPTLIMMKNVVANAAIHNPERAALINFSHAQASVTAFHKAGVTIIAGTDANMAPMSPAQVPHGVALHDELALLVEAGLSPREALRAATIVPAQYFSLADRGAIEPGRRADLVLIAGDPTTDITATRSIDAVWIAGDRVR